MLPGGRLTVEDAYAYGKFARVALGTNDVDARVRPHSDEELAPFPRLSPLNPRATALLLRHFFFPSPDPSRS